MPRLQPWLLRQARLQSRDLGQLIFACRDLSLAKQELRWINDHFQHLNPSNKVALVSKACIQRGRGVPLQYILGSQPFSSLDIKCRPGVLIPRPETEAYTVHLAELVKRGTLLGHKPRDSPNGINIIDFCSGTGCIPLLLFKTLRRMTKQLKVYGFDVSPVATELGRRNISRNSLISDDPKQSVEILQGDLFNDKDIEELPSLRWDIMVSNPPYVSSDVWDNGRNRLSYSTRKFEPRLALVPGQHLQVPQGWHHADIFYARLWDVAKTLRPRALLLEVGDEEQIRRVVSCFILDDVFRNSTIQVWRDWLDAYGNAGEQESMKIVSTEAHKMTVNVMGTGNIRSLFIKLPKHT